MIRVDLEIGQIANMKTGLRPAIDAAMRDALKDLTVQVHAHIVEQVQSKLHSTRDKYLQHLHFKQVSDDTTLITLDRDAMWIEEGIPPNYNMLDGLLKSKKAKTAADGSRYVVVPFEHKKGPTQQTPAQTSLTDTIKKEFKDRKIPYGKLEVGKDGKPKTGLLHSFDIMHSPVKTGQGPGQGHGPVGAVRQGPTGIPFLQGVRVYQKEFTDKAGKSSVKKSIVTFRIASSKHQGTGRWIHPGLEAKRFLDEAASWAKQLWSEEISKKIAISVSNRF